VSPGEIDRALLVLARTRGHTPARDRRVAQFSALGEHGACWIALGLAGGVRERVRDPGRSAAWVRGSALVALAYLANTALKLIVRRPRPQLPGLPALIATETGLGFPSAHATTSFAAARRYGRLTDGRPLYALAATLAASRVYLGVHHPSDVAAGAALGTAIAGRGGRRWR
jgi:membrane-associated phospholipid phosphatase